MFKPLIVIYIEGVILCIIIIYNMMYLLQAMKGVVFLLSQTGRILFIGEKIESYIGYTQVGNLFLVFIRNRLISGGLRLVLINTKNLCLVLYPVFRARAFCISGLKNTGFNHKIVHFISAESYL